MDRNCINKIIKKSKEMRKDGTGYVKAELITWYQDHAYEYLPQCYINYKNLFVQRYCDADLHKYDLLIDRDFLFKGFINNFKEWCELVEKISGFSILDKMEDEVEVTDKIFLTLIRQVHTFTRRAKEICWSVEEIADNVLYHMEDYYGSISCHPGMTIEEDLLDCLMFHIPDYYATA